mgnify:FL=1
MNMTPAGDTSANANTIFIDFMGFKVIPGYEMKIVVFHPEAAINHGVEYYAPHLHELPITIDRSVPGRIVIMAGNETINLTEP